MTKIRWFLFAIAIAFGLGLGLYYGWVLSPVEYTDTEPSTLRVDFRADYTLMVAEVYDRDHDIQNAVRQLALLGDQQPIFYVSEAISFGQQNNFNPVDLKSLQNLSTGLQTSTAQPGSNRP